MRLLACVLALALAGCSVSVGTGNGATQTALGTTLGGLTFCTKPNGNGECVLMDTTFPAKTQHVYASAPLTNASSSADIKFEFFVLEKGAKRSLGVSSVAPPDKNSSGVLTQHQDNDNGLPSGMYELDVTVKDGGKTLTQSGTYTIQ